MEVDFANFLLVAFSFPTTEFFMWKKVAVVEAKLFSNVLTFND